MAELAEAVTDAEKTFALLVRVLSEMHDIKTKLASDVVTVDEWSTPNSNGTVFNTNKAFYQPIEVEYILATWPVGSTSVTLQLGDRIIPLQPTAGVFVADVKIQLEWDDVRSLTIAPAGNGYLEIMGHMVEKVFDRR
jgi:hypothetical protein